MEEINTIQQDYNKIISKLYKERFWESPINRMLKSEAGSAVLSYDEWTKQHAYKGIGEAAGKKWVAKITPVELLNRTIKQAVESVFTLNESGKFFRFVPDNIKSPDYGDKWGRNANYIEINNRTIAKMIDNRCSDGILSAIKLLPAIPPSAKSWANCVILSQVFPNIYGDGYNKPTWEENSLYGIKLNAGISENVYSKKLVSAKDAVSAEEQIKIFNDLAHARGLKTGFRTLISEDQLKIARPYQEDEAFHWSNPEHVRLYIEETVKVVKLGFDAIFVDSAKHVNGFEPWFYTGVGATPDYEQMQYIIFMIRKESGNEALSFVGERCDRDIARYKEMGLTAGTAWGDANNISDIKYWSDVYKYSRDFAPGPEVSNDNDEGGSTYEERLNKMRSCLFGFEFATDKLPSFMQMHDLFPLRYDTNTHALMMTNPSYSQDNTPKSHWENLFAKEDGRLHNHNAAEIFAYALGF